jgi:hypothetical protein
MTTKVESNIGADIAKSDDLMKSWSISELLVFLGFPIQARNGLQWYWQEKETVTLSEVFDFVISCDEVPRSGIIISKLLNVHCIGIKTLHAIVRHMTELDFGKNCNRVWKEKYKLFQNARRVKGSRTIGWTAPITHD